MFPQPLRLQSSPIHIDNDFRQRVGNFVFLFVTRRQPLYHGSSFSYIRHRRDYGGKSYAEGADLTCRSRPLSSASSCRVLSRLSPVDREPVRRTRSKVLPATITGPVAMAIGLTLAAIDSDASSARPESLKKPCSRAKISPVISLITLI